MVDGVGAALDLPHDPARLRIVLFLTDGYVGNEDEVLATVHAKLGASRLFSFGVGTAVNRYLLEEMATFGRGTATVVRPDEDTKAAVERLHGRIATPVLTDIAIDWKGLAVEDLEPAAPPDLFLGQPLVLHGRYRAAGRATIEVRGNLGGRRVTLPVAVDLPEREDRDGAVAAVWAKARIRELGRSLLKRADPKIVERITELSLQHGLLTRYTAFVAVSEKVTKGGPAATVPVPLERPEGMPGAMSGRGSVASGSGFGSGAFGVTTTGVGGGGAGYGIGVAHKGEAGKTGSLGALGADRMRSAESLFDDGGGGGSPSFGARLDPVARPGFAPVAPAKEPAERRSVAKDAPIVTSVELHAKSGGATMPPDARAAVTSRIRSTYLSGVVKCRSEALRRGVGLGTHLWLDVRISPSGAVLLSRRGGAGDAGFDRCLAGLGATWRFDAIKGAAGHEIFITFNFRGE